MHSPDAMENRSPIAPRSLMRSVLLRIVFVATLAVGALTVLAYGFIYTGTQQRMLDNLSDWVTERARNDSVIFELAQENLSRFSAEFLRLYTSDVSVNEETFWSYYFTDDDNAVRMHRSFYEGIHAPDGLYYEGLTSFVGNNQPVDDPDLQRRLILAARLLTQLGPAWTNRFANVHTSFPENAIVIYAPGTSWGLDAAPDLPMNELGVIRSMLQSENPDREPAWTGLYYDETAEEWALTYQVPLDLDGRHLINPSHDVPLTAMMEKLVRDVPEGGYNLIFRSDGYLIAHPAEPASDRRWVGQLSPENIDDPGIIEAYELIRETTGGNPGEVSLVHNPGAAAWMAVSELSGPDWWFVSMYPEALIRQSANQAAVAVLVSGVILLLLLIAVIAYIIRRDAERPLRLLREAAHQIKTGNYSAVADGKISLPRHLNNEVGLLADAFHDMSVNIRDAQSTLEQIVEERTRELEAANSSLRELSLLDGLLGIHNRRSFDRDIRSVFAETRLGKGEFYLMLADVDAFKLFNDTYGHMEGDQVLRQIAETIAGIIRDEDRVYRFGGEELAVIFNRRGAESADRAAQRVMAAMRNLAIPFPESEHGIVTMSAGMVRCGQHHHSVDDVIAEADGRLYAAKHRGRNRLVFDEP